MVSAPQLHRRDHVLTGARILILEDQVDVADRLVAAVTDAGGDVVAVARTIDRALALIQSEAISAAIITMSVGGVHTEAAARELIRRNIPFAVTTGIGSLARNPALHGALSITKPFQNEYVQMVLADLLGRRSDQ